MVYLVTARNRPRHMTRFSKRILPPALCLVSISLSVPVHAKAPERAHPRRQAPTDSAVWLQLRQEALQQQVLQREMVNLARSLREDASVTRLSVRDANDRLEKQMAQGFQTLDGRIGFIQTLLVLIFIAVLAVLGSALLMWRELTKLEQTSGYRLATVEPRTGEVADESDKRITGP
jgi:hypothetical protein